MAGGAPKMTSGGTGSDRTAPPLIAPKNAGFSRSKPEPRAPITVLPDALIHSWASCSLDERGASTVTSYRVRGGAFGAETEYASHDSRQGTTFLSWAVAGALTETHTTVLPSALTIGSKPHWQPGG